MHGWYFKVFLTYADQLAYDAEVTRALVKNNVTVLVLARVGLLGEKGEDMVIRPKDRALLGVKYCPSRKCQHPRCMVAVRVKYPEGSI